MSPRSRVDGLIGLMSGCGPNHHWVQIPTIATYACNRCNSGSLDMCASVTSFVIFEAVLKSKYLYFGLPRRVVRGAGRDVITITASDGLKTRAIMVLCVCLGDLIKVFSQLIIYGLDN